MYFCNNDPDHTEPGSCGSRVAYRQAPISCDQRESLLARRPIKQGLNSFSILITPV